MANVPVIAFGPNPDIYYIGLGLRYYMSGMPASVQNTIQKWPAMQLKWMSIDVDGAWAARDGGSLRTEYDTTITQPAIDKIVAFPTAEYVTFGTTKDMYCAVTPGNGWGASLEDEQIDSLQQVKASMGEQLFDQTLKGIVFGKGMTMIFLFSGSFSYYTDREAEGSQMESLLNEYIYRQPSWTVEPGSVLCPWSIDYYFLKFKNPQTGEIKMHWNLPPTMDANLADLQATFNTPEAQQAIANRQQLGLVQAISNYNVSLSAANALRQTWW
ncbi:hypothetical protein JR316_0001737 [Psilocybe cubensis]|uniref:Uncharacterized protein n=2 Tax=Psilocybe cubensis TaxID=181762 RepID=A0A8H7Y7A5_PSICU|nr:hypothetical protein JR316_0001737 [Psilocybe cubensis]KAH9484835.1 hypothetical protein JR316_0001737 [Psilocybe cubensis]